MSTNALSPEALRALEKAKLLLAVEGRTEEEAAIFVAKAMDILAKHNLSLGDAENATQRTSGGARKDEKNKGGLYQWQRDIWKASAELNFCLYFSIKGLTKGATYQNRIVGRPENVVGAQVMAQYLQQTIERLAQEWAKANGINVFKREAIAYREGMADRLSSKLRHIRLKADAAERERGASQGTPGTALTIVKVTQSEADLNNDYMNGYAPGTTATMRAAREVDEAKRRKQWEDFLAANPNWQAEQDAKYALYAAERAKKEAARVRRAEKAGRDPHATQYRQPTEREKRQETAGYMEGYEKAGEISLDRQIDEEQQEKLT